MVDVSGLSAETRKRIADMLDDVLKDVEAEDNKPIDIPAYATMPRERDLGALRDADQIIKELADLGHGDYSAYREEIADLWDGDYGLWNGNDECTTDIGNPDLKELRLIQEDHYDQHMSNKPKWKDMICSVGDYLFFA